MKKATLYMITDEEGKLWQDETDFDRERLMIRFVSGWLPRAKITGSNAYLIWGAFKAAGWEIIEREIEVPLN